MGKHAADTHPRMVSPAAQWVVANAPGADIPDRIGLCTRWSRLSYAAI